MPDSTAVAVEVSDLTKKYGDVTAANGISFSVLSGETFGIVGPNGAGKTTTLEMIEGLSRPTSGRIRVLGLELPAGARKVKERIGVQLQSTALIPSLTVSETLSMFGSLYRHRLDTASLLRRFGLEEKRRASVSHLSGGQKQGLCLALALINDPDVVFLDEPTTGLDPTARRSLWNIIRDLRGDGRTIIMTTHYMDEAEELCQRVAIFDHGRVIALDTPANLIRSLKSSTTIECDFQTLPEVGVLERLPGVASVRYLEKHVLLNCDDHLVAMRELLNLESAAATRIDDIKIRLTTLEDVYIALTGRRFPQA